MQSHPPSISHKATWAIETERHKDGVLSGLLICNGYVVAEVGHKMLLPDATVQELLRLFVNAPHLHALCNSMLQAGKLNAVELQMVLEKISGK